MEKQIINYFLERRHEAYRGHEVAKIIADMIKPKRKSLDTSMLSDSDIEQLIKIIRAVEMATGLDFDQFNVKTKKGELAKIRFLFMYHTKTIMRLTLSQIGQLMGGRDHSTIIHGVKEVNNWLGNRVFYSRENKLIDDIRRHLESSEEG